MSWLLDSLRCRKDLNLPISGQRTCRALLLRSNDCSLAKFPIAGNETNLNIQTSVLNTVINIIVLDNVLTFGNNDQIV